MAEKRLIDEENLLKEYEQIDWYCVSKEGQFMRGATTEDNPFIHYYDGEKIIKNAPTVDAVEVVRCKKCIYFEPYTDYLDGKTCNRGYCIYWEREALAADTTIFDHDFCSRGKRKD